MSILKGILHHWNKTNKNYDTIHPETESSQVTDWHSGIMASLASKTLGTVVDAITTDSVLGKLIKMLLNASGVKYLIDTNGYICFGSFFGGLIIQWGIASLKDDTGGWVKYPLSFPNAVYNMECTHYNSLTSAINIYLEVSYLDNAQAYIRSSRDSTQVHFLAVGH